MRDSDFFRTGLIAVIAGLRTGMFAVLVGLLAAFMGACTRPGNQVAVEAHCESGRPRTLSERFDEALYNTDGRGRWDVVLHRLRPAARDPSQSIEQLIHLSLFWKPVPGTTFVESSQTDALMTYALFSGPTAISYEGAGFVYLAQARGGGITGRIESGTLSPTRRVGEPLDLLGHCRVTGEFQARMDRGRATELIALAAQRLGPMPSVSMPPAKSEPR